MIGECQYRTACDSHALSRYVARLSLPALHLHAMRAASMVHGFTETRNVAGRPSGHGVCSDDSEQ